MTKDEIKKALEYCTNWRLHCPDCPYFNCSNGNCFDTIKLDALNLITEQEKEIEQLKAKNEQLEEDIDMIIKEQKDDYKFDIIQAKIDVLKELKQVIHYDVFDQLCPDCAKAGASVLEQIDDIIKEIEK